MPAWDLGEFLETVYRLGAAAFLGGLVGFEREHRHKPMGLRTMILVATGSALMTVLALRLASEWSDAPSGNDPGRVIQGIVSGIGLLGAGAFLHAGERVRGATTGASVWLVGGIGIGCGLGAFVDAAIATAVGIVALAGLGALERKLMRTAPESGPERQHPPLSPSDRSTGPSSGP